MKRLFLTAATLAAFGCSVLPHHDTNPYTNAQFYERYLNPGANAVDAQIQRDLDSLRANPDSAATHNELGGLLVQKGFPKDAEREFERAVNADTHFYPAWYNLGLVRASRGDNAGAKHAFSRTVHYKPGHSAALFQLGLVEERAQNEDAAVAYYAKAFAINHSLLDVRVNPRIVDSRLVHRALIASYAKEHARQTMSFQGTPNGYGTRLAPTDTLQSPSPSPQAPAQNIVTPAPPVTDPGAQRTPPNSVPVVPPAPAPAPAPRPAIAPPAPASATSAVAPPAPARTPTPAPVASSSQLNVTAPAEPVDPNDKRPRKGQKYVPPAPQPQEQQPQQPQ